MAENNVNTPAAPEFPQKGRCEANGARFAAARPFSECFT